VKVVYAEKALQDMGWFRRYYSTVFPEGKGRARESLLRTEALIAENPSIGHPVEHGSEAREFPLLRTPFVIIFRVKSDRIEILRVLDLRAEG
jgi:plasmid stabilization system protein ParE